MLLHDSPNAQSNKAHSLSRRTVLSAVTVAGAGLALTSMTTPAHAGKVSAPTFGASAAISSLGITGTIVARHRGIFRSFASMGSNVAQHIRVNGVNYLASVNTSSGRDSFQVFNSDTGKLHFKASTSTTAQGTLTPDGKGRIYFASGKQIMVADIAKKTLRPLPYSAQDVTSYQGLVFDYRGRLWVATYPTGNLICLDATTGKEIFRTSRLGKSNDYTKGLSISPDRKTLWVGTGTNDPDLFRVRVDYPQSPARIGVPNKGVRSFVNTTKAMGRKVFVWYEDKNKKSAFQVYDIYTQTWETPNFTLGGTAISEADPSGYVYVNRYGVINRFNPSQQTLTLQRVGIVSFKGAKNLTLLGNSLYVTDIVDTKLVAVRISTSGVFGQQINYQVADTILDTRSVVIDKSTNIAYTGGYRGDGLCSLNLSTGQFQHSPESSEIEQIEGMIADRGHLYVGSYGDSVIARYNTFMPLTNKSSYAKLATLGSSHHQSRPFAWASTSKHVAFGTVPEYGYRGGALGVIERSTGRVKVHNRIIPDLSIVGLVGSGDIVYGTTSVLGGMGSATYTGFSVVFAANVLTGKLLWKRVLTDVDESQSPTLLNGKLYVGVASGVIEMNVKDGKPLRTFTLKPRTMAAGWQKITLKHIPGTTRLAHIASGKLTILELSSGQRGVVLEGVGEHIVFDKTNNMWVTMGNDLIQLRLTDSPSGASIKERHRLLGGFAKVGYPTGLEVISNGAKTRSQSFSMWGKITTITWHQGKGTSYAITYPKN